MTQPTYKPTHLRAWRKFRGLSQAELAERMLDANGNRVVSNVSISRIEKGVQPYTQPVLEALAKALDTTPQAIIAYPPGKIADCINAISSYDEKKTNQILAFIAAISND
ncbi:helix-turn-helix transcriptional regulator [Breoghania sp.]|uniref:helix-turn-helix domain-containing protein n=1 Tax=Breoghania sp. TaxID=2065378 RepID=UPI002AA6745F|nr:helix-turn-helix transcriptional regulator [Breoghania sp.]